MLAPLAIWGAGFINDAGVDETVRIAND